ncbi:DUF6939 family protein [Streptomyces pini]|uniref:Uncharacterized protein n=1 Tax=Streptomyces pini TaxID=1520580 RepID=A0A1I3X3U9_9ACTN|nr:hypothetical protein [Streptomyces pini]SFK14375.1 hypothetical protein SAMN05192584_10425 [Streptomyces pini]
MTIHVAGRRRTPDSLGRAFPGAEIVDVTSRAEEPWVRLSPFFPHGGIPVPFSGGLTGRSVEGVWQALKVFRDTDVDLSKLDVTTMRGLKRTVRRYGPVLGHRAGPSGERLLGYEAARRLIYLPSYRWVLENRVADLVSRLRETAAETDVVLLDHTTNGDVADLATPLSHAALLRSCVEGRRPSEEEPPGEAPGPAAEPEPGEGVRTW